MAGRSSTVQCCGASPSSCSSSQPITSWWSQRVSTTTWAERFGCSLPSGPSTDAGSARVSHTERSQSISFCRSAGLAASPGPL